MEENKEISVLKQRVKVLELKQKALHDKLSRDTLDKWKIISDLTSELDKQRKEIEEIKDVL